MCKNLTKDKNMKTMNTLKTALTAVFAVATLIASPGKSWAEEPSLYVYSTIDALLAGAYDGEQTIANLKKKGDFGLGTFNHLDGEMVASDGVFYHIQGNGAVSVAKPEDKVPLAYVLPFLPNGGFPIGKNTPTGQLLDLESLVDARLGNKNLFYAVKIIGQFHDVTTRAIFAQIRPYKPLSEVSKTQSIFKRPNVDGTLIGIRSPAFTKGISVTGWHWHFISEDKSFGGHVLALGVTQGDVTFSSISRFDVDLPKTDDFAAADQSKDRAAELSSVEHLRK
jgi:acetolactate decarboxylase